MNKMRQLVDRINKTAYQYYVLDEPTLSDKEWDKLYDELVLMERESGVVLPDSPTRRVGGDPLSSFTPHRHVQKLLSMDKAQSMDTLRDWARRCEKLRNQSIADGNPLPPLRYVVEHKFDGLTINLTYEEGELSQAATRGNGEVGEGILPQARTIKSVPLRIPFAGKIEVRGEAYMRLSVFDKYNQTAVEPLKNPRNGAAGALRNLDPSVTGSRKLSCSFYDVGYINEKVFSDQQEMIGFLRKNQFPLPSCERFCDTIEQAIEVVHEIERERASLDYMIDGAVIKVCDFETRRAFGDTEKFPRWAIAYKYEAEEVTATLEEVTWEVGRTGKLTPLAHLEAVEIAGATVRRATLNNWGDILRKRVKLGAKVWVRRSNEVIPEIMGRVEEYVEGEREIEKPSKCPSCGTVLIERGAHLFCTNREGCRPQIVARLSHFASRDAMDIEGFSEKTAEQLYDELGICEPSQLYLIQAEQLSRLDRFGEKKAQNLIDALVKSKEKALDAFVYALGIPNVGRKTAFLLADRYGSILALAEAPMEELTAIPDVGEIVASSILQFFSDPLNREQIKALGSAGISPIFEQTSNNGPFGGMTVVVTGSLDDFSRSEAEQAILRAGGKPVSSVSKNTSMVVAGTSAGSKLEKAVKLGVRVINEAEFKTILDGKS